MGKKQIKGVVHQLELISLSLSTQPTQCVFIHSQLGPVTKHSSQLNGKSSGFIPVNFIDIFPWQPPCKLRQPEVIKSSPPLSRSPPPSSSPSPPVRMEFVLTVLAFNGTFVPRKSICLPGSYAASCQPRKDWLLKIKECITCLRGHPFRTVIIHIIVMMFCVPQLLRVLRQLRLFFFFTPGHFLSPKSTLCARNVVTPWPERAVQGGVRGWGLERILRAAHKGELNANWWKLWSVTCFFFFLHLFKLIVGFLTCKISLWVVYVLAKVRKTVVLYLLGPKPSEHPAKDYPLNITSLIVIPPSKDCIAIKKCSFWPGAFNHMRKRNIWKQTLVCVHKNGILNI